MATIRGTLIACAAIVSAGAVSVEAGDHGRSFKAHYGSMKDYTPVIHSRRSWYVRGDAAYAMHDDPFLIRDSSTNLIQPDFENTWSFGGGIGKNFSDHIRGDFTVEYRTEADVEATSVSGFIDGRHAVGLSSTVLMANFYYDFGNRSHFTPYLGVGLGAVRHDISAGTVPGGTIEGNETWNAAAAFMAGISMDLTRTRVSPLRRLARQGLHVDLGYRFLYMGETETGAITSGANTARQVEIEDLHGHEFRMGLRYEFR